jgi:hypothetical protein
LTRRTKSETISANKRLAVAPDSCFDLGIFVALGLALSGFFVARAVETAKTFERFVTVKGLSECEVPADLAI